MAAPPTPFDRWFVVGAWASLAVAVLLLAVAILPVGLVWAEPNTGADVNITAEFYTAFEGGGGYITWDFSTLASQTLRARIDSVGDGNGFVSPGEYQAFQGDVNDAFEKDVLVFRNFEVAAVRVVEARGLAGVPVNATDLGHLKLIMNGQWAQRDSDIRLANDAALARVYGNLTNSERVRERTLIISAGGSTFTSSMAEARVLRVPGGSVVAAVLDYSPSTRGAVQNPAVHYGRFSFVDSTLILLAPLAIAYFVGVRAPRLEQEASRQRRVVPFHRMLSNAYLLLVVSYFAGAPAPALWGAGLAFGALGLYLSFRFYPEEPAPDRLLSADDLRRPPASPKFDEEDASGELPAGSMARPQTALEFLPEAVGPLERPDDAARMPALPNPALAQARDLLPSAVTPLDLPEEATPRPEGRAKSVAPAPPAPRAAPAPGPAPKAPAAPPKTQVRCPGCKHHFEAEGRRPLSITCPHCGRHGVLR